VEGKSSVIIKKVKKGGHGGHHGGSWKVAYADFVTAMMGFFLLMWLHSMSGPEKRARVSQYFRTFTIFDKGGTSMIPMHDVNQTLKMINPPQETEGETKSKGKGEADATAAAEQAKANQKAFMEKLRQQVETRLADVKDHVIVKPFEGGVRIEVIDKEGRAMFPLGSAEMNGDARKILQVVAENLKTYESKIVIEGHTDALTMASRSFSNWELSTARASSARQEMERQGLDPNRLLRVAGYAATQPLIPQNPYDQRNRRISILLFHGVATTAPGAATGASVVVPSLDLPGRSAIVPAN